MMMKVEMMMVITINEWKTDDECSLSREK